MRILIILALIGLVSCSTRKTGDEKADKVISHLDRPDINIRNEQFDEKFEVDGLINGEYIAIGSAVDLSGTRVSDTALIMKAQRKAYDDLLLSAPTDYKKIVQRAINTLTGEETVDLNSIAVTEVYGLTGMKSGFSDSKCIRRVIPTPDLKYIIEKECRSIVRIPAEQLANAFDFTLSKKYGVSKKSIQNQIKLEMLSNLSGSEDDFTHGNERKAFRGTEVYTGPRPANDSGSVTDQQIDNVVRKEPMFNWLQDKPASYRRNYLQSNYKPEQIKHWTELHE